AETEARAHHVLDAASDAFVGTDGGGQILSWNQRAEATFGWNRQEAVGRRLVETIVPVAAREEFRTAMERLLLPGQAAVLSTTLDLTALHRDGRQFPVTIAVTAMRLRQGHYVGTFVRHRS